MPTFLSVSPAFATPYSQWGSDIAEFSSSGPPSATANAKGTAEPHGSVSEVKAAGGPVPVRQSVYPKRTVVCSRDSTRSYTYPTLSPTTTILQTCLSSPTSSFPSSAYIAAYLFASPRVVNHSILPIGTVAAMPSKPTNPSITSPTSPARDALGLSPDTLRGAPSLQPGTAKEERERRLQAVSHQRKAELPEMLRRVDASKDSLSSDRPNDGTSRSAKEQLKPKAVPRDHARSSASYSQTTVRKAEPETVRCTTTPLDWPHPNSAAGPRFPPLTPSTRPLNVEASSIPPAPKHSVTRPPYEASSVAASVSDLRARPVMETQDSSAYTHASASRSSPSVMEASSRNAVQQAVPSIRRRMTRDEYNQRRDEFAQKMHNRQDYTRDQIHRKLLDQGLVQLSDVERVTLKTKLPVSQSSNPAMVMPTAAAVPKLPDEQRGPRTSSKVQDDSSAMLAKPADAPSALPKSKSSRSLRQVATPRAHDGAMPSIQASVPSLPHAQDAGTEAAKVCPTTGVTSPRTPSHHVSRLTPSGSQTPSMSVQSSGSINMAQTMGTITHRERAIETAKSTTSTRSRAATVSGSERGSLTGEKSRSYAALSRADTARDRPSAKPREDVTMTSSSTKARPSQKPQVVWSQASSAKPSVVRAEETAPLKTARQELARQASSASTPSILSTAALKGPTRVDEARSAVEVSVEKALPTSSVSSHSASAPLTTTASVRSSPRATIRADTSRETPSVRQQGTSPNRPLASSKVEKPKPLAPFAKDMQTELSEDHRADTDYSVHDPITPLARFFTASVVGSTVAAEDDFGSTVEDSPFGQLKSLPFSISTFGPDIWKSASLIEVNAMKPHFSDSPTRMSLAGLVVSDTDDLIDGNLGATSSEESLPRGYRRSRAMSNVHVMALSNASDSTVSTADERVMRSDPSLLSTGTTRSPFLLREPRPSEQPPRYSSVTGAGPAPPTQEKGRIIPHQRWLMGDRMAGRPAVRDVLASIPPPPIEFRLSAQLRGQARLKRIAKEGSQEFHWEWLKANGNPCQKAWARAMLKIRSRKVEGPSPGGQPTNVAPAPPSV